MAALRSMTGFGAACVAREGLTLRCELRSVNHRHLVVRVKAPHELGGLDVEVEKRVKARLSRGSVTCSIWLERAGEAGAAELNTALMAHYAAALQEFHAQHGQAVTGPVSIDRLLSLPGVVGTGDDAELTEDARYLALAAADEALDNMDAMRAAEGEAMARDLAGHVAELTALRERVGERMPDVVRAHFAALQERAAELMGDAAGEAGLDSGDLARELALLSDRHDVSEELSRLDSHAAQLGEVLGGGGPVGRKLDFLIQECLREVNTIGSKCNDAQVAHAVVDMKNVVERLREQAQNVE